MGPYGPIWAPTRTGPQPGLGPNPGPGLLVQLPRKEPEEVLLVLYI